MSSIALASTSGEMGSAMYREPRTAAAALSARSVAPPSQAARTASVTACCPARAPATSDRSGAVRKMPVAPAMAAAAAAASVFSSTTNHATGAVTPSCSAEAMALASALASPLFA